MAALELSRARSGWQRARAAPRPPAGTRQRSTRSAIGCTPAWVSRARVARGGALAAHAPCRPPGTPEAGTAAGPARGSGAPGGVPTCCLLASRREVPECFSRYLPHPGVTGTALLGALPSPPRSATQQFPLPNQRGSGGRLPRLRARPREAVGERSGLRQQQRAAGRDVSHGHPPTAPAPRPAAWDNRDERYQQLM